MDEATIPAGTHRSVHWLRRSRSWLVALMAGVATLATVGVVGSASMSGAPVMSPAFGVSSTSRFIVESSGSNSPTAVVQGVHGHIVSDLAPIHAVIASLTSSQASDIGLESGVSISPDQVVKLQSTGSTSSGVGTWGPQSTNGNSTFTPGMTLHAGYTFEVPSNHPAIQVSFVNASETFAVSCFNGGAGGAITVPFPAATYADPANDTYDWLPTSSKSAAVGLQGKVTVPDLCNGGQMNASQGATFSADVRAGTAAYPVQIKWHYIYGSNGGNWGGSYSVTPDTTAGSTSPSHGPTSVFTQVTGATSVWAQGDQGAGATVAVVDTGIDAALPDFGNRVVDGVDLSGEGNAYQDSYGHGTFIAGLIASNGASSNGQYMGEAPAADLVSVKVAGAAGSTTVGSVIQGISWVIANKAKDRINVLNLSLGAQPTGPASTEPLDQAVEAAWNAGIVVVVSAGNAGPFNGTVLSPGDDPLAITVGAIDDGGGTNPLNFSVPSFTSVGPTLFDGTFKPDLAAPGRSVVSLAAPGSTIYNQNPSAVVGTSNFVGSGTSFSTAITSGMAALMLSAQPSLTPNEVKGRLIFTASNGPVGDPFLDGHGVGNVQAAIGASNVEFSQALASALEAAGPATTVTLASTWAGSTWNAAAWSGAGVQSLTSTLSNQTGSVLGATWNGSTWNGSTWNGATWNGAIWNGALWNGALWNGALWNGATWNGATWNGSIWNGATWNGSTWNGSLWNGTTWNGTTWNGSVWNSDNWSSAPTGSGS